MEVVELRHSRLSSDFSVIIPTRNLEGWRIRNCVASLRQQTVQSEIIISDYGSDAPHLNSLATLSDEYGCALFHVETDHVWNISKAYNVGLRRCRGKWAATIDADIIFEPGVVEDTVRRLRGNERAFIVRQPTFLGVGVKCAELSFPSSYAQLSGEPRLYVAPSVGSFSATNVSWWRDVGGYDERFLGYGSEDWEMYRRASWSKRRIRVIGDPRLKRFPAHESPESGCLIYHQWHPPTPERLGMPERELALFREANRKIQLSDRSMVRNGPEWGIMNVDT